MSVIPVNSINALVLYLWHDEKIHFDAGISSYLDGGCADDFPDDHIFLSVKKVADWLHGLTMEEYEESRTERHFSKLESRIDPYD